MYTVLTYLPTLVCFRLKTVSQYVKDEAKSPLFTKSGKLSGISETLYYLLLSGVKGQLKLDNVLTALKEVTVSFN